MRVRFVNGPFHNQLKLVKVRQIVLAIEPRELKIDFTELNLEPIKTLNYYLHELRTDYGTPFYEYWLEGTCND